MTSTEVDKPLPIVRFVVGSSGGGNRWLLLALAFTFVFAGMAAIALTRPAQADVWTTFAIWLICSAGATLVMKLCLPGHDPLLLAIPLFLSGWGLVAIERLAPAFADRQAIWLIISIVAMLAVACLPHLLRWLRRFCSCSRQSPSGAIPRAWNSRPVSGLASAPSIFSLPS